MNDTTEIAAAGLAGIAALHALWAAGSTWPLADRNALADAVCGRTDGSAPGPLACLTVSGLLAGAAGLVGGYPRRAPRLRRAGAGAVISALVLRGTLSLAGRVDLAVPSAVSTRFRALDRQAYGPLCFTLAALALPAAVELG